MTDIPADYQFGQPPPETAHPAADTDAANGGGGFTSDLDRLKQIIREDTSKGTRFFQLTGARRDVWVELSLDVDTERYGGWATDCRFTEPSKRDLVNTTCFSATLIARQCVGIWLSDPADPDQPGNKLAPGVADPAVSAMLQVGRPEKPWTRNALLVRALFADDPYMDKVHAVWRLRSGVADLSDEGETDEAADPT